MCVRVSMRLTIIIRVAGPMKLQMKYVSKRSQHLWREGATVRGRERERRREREEKKEGRRKREMERERDPERPRERERKGEGGREAESIH